MPSRRSLKLARNGAAHEAMAKLSAIWARAAALLLGAVSLPAEADVWTYLKAYQPGIELGVSQTNTGISYEAATPESGAPPAGCAQKQTDPGRMKCSTTLTSSSSVPFSAFLQQPFKRTGWFYFDADLGFS